MHAITDESEQKIKNRKVRYSGIVADSKKLGVNQSTLYRALKGKWRLPGLLERYHKLKAEQIKGCHDSAISGQKSDIKQQNADRLRNDIPSCSVSKSPVNSDFHFSENQNSETGSTDKNPGPGKNQSLKLV